MTVDVVRVAGVHVSIRAWHEVLAVDDAIAEMRGSGEVVHRGYAAVDDGDADARAVVALRPNRRSIDRLGGVLGVGERDAGGHRH